MAKKPKEVEVIDMKGVKMVKRKVSWIRWVYVGFAVFTLLWAPFVWRAPLYVKDHYGQQIKKSIVVSMFFDLQRNMQEEYAKLLKGIANKIDLKKPVGYAIDKVKMAEKPIEKVEAATAQAQKTTDKASKLTGLVGSKLGVNTGAADKAIASAEGVVTKVDDTTKMVNERLDKVKTELERVAQMEIDKEMDKLIKEQLDNYTGLGTTLLTNYGIKHVMPWKPSTWPITNKIYNDLEKSSLSVVRSLTALVDQYYGLVMWMLVYAAWIAGAVIWFMVLGKIKSLTKPFVVCPRCGHTFTDKKRLGMMVVNMLKPWNWFM
ncbi:MAG: hypothetical protein FWE50_00150 [Alphaproteobacteria bacterium]|nr:hypothetical protein [Alphaproteobacteria bacterium]